MRRRKRKVNVSEVIVYGALIATVIFFALIQAYRLNSLPKVMQYGATFSIDYAQNLGLDWKQTFLASLDDLGIRSFRIPMYWSDLETASNEYHFTDIDWIVSEAEKRGAKLSLVVGRKVPRWPECYIPDWAEKLSPEFENQALLDFVSTAVRRYDSSAVVERWQVENEPLYDFGNCPPPDGKLFDRELALVRSLSSKPILLTTSGENEFWNDTAIPADVLGVSMYRTTWNPLFGYSVYPLGPDFYGAKALAVRPFVDKVVVSELQAEPWLALPIQSQAPADLVKQFTADELQSNVDFARQAGFDEVYFWGAEYWYWMKVNGYPDLWDTAKKMIYAR